MTKYTFCDDWTKIVVLSWFGARIYPRALTQGSWPLNFRIEILKYTFSLVFVKKKFSPIIPTVKKIIGDKLVTNRQTTDNRQTDILSWPQSIWEFYFYFFIFFAYGRERTNWFIPPCLLCKFASLTCFARRGIKQNKKVKECTVRLLQKIRINAKRHFKTKQKYWIKVLF